MQSWCLLVKVAALGCATFTSVARSSADVIGSVPRSLGKMSRTGDLHTGPAERRHCSGGPVGPSRGGVACGEDRERLEDVDDQSDDEEHSDDRPDQT